MPISFTQTFLFKCETEATLSVRFDRAPLVFFLCTSSPRANLEFVLEDVPYLVVKPFTLPSNSGLELTLREALLQLLSQVSSACWRRSAQSPTGGM